MHALGSQKLLITHVPASFLFLELVEASTALEIQVEFRTEIPHNITMK